jgi:hypothetical protein
MRFAAFMSTDAVHSRDVKRAYMETGPESNSPIDAISYDARRIKERRSEHRFHCGSHHRLRYAFTPALIAMLGQS